MVAPTSWSPGALCTGRLSPVTVDSSTSLSPSTTSASTGTFAPGRISSRSPTSHLGGRDLDRLAVAHHDGHRRCEVEQRADRIVRAAAGAHLEPVAEQHEARQHRRRLVEDLALDEERGGDRVEPAHADRNRDQHHHVERARPQGGDRAHEEDRRGVEDDRQAEQELPQLHLEPERHRQLEPNSVSPTGDQMTIGIVNTSATTKRLRMSRTIASIDMPAWPPCAVPVRLLGALGRVVVVRAGARRSGSQMWPGADCPAQW